jgi:putative ABC transport system substrate-binding protein
MLEMLKTAIPGLLRVAVPSEDYPSRLEGAAKMLGIEVKGTDVRSPDDIARFLAFARKAGAGAVMYPNIPRLNPLTERLAQDATRARFPAIGWHSNFAKAGCLLSYGPTGAEVLPRVADKVDKILRGANPADLAVELPTQFALVINLKTAKALGLSIPQSLLLRADEVIQ